LRWHRHLTGEGGQATDVAIGTQLPTDVHQNVRGLITKTYKFKKLTALGAEGTYAWLLFDGHLCPKGGHYKNGTGRYDPEVFPLYASSAAAAEGKHVELRTNKNDSIWSGGKAWAAIIFPVLLLIGGLFGLWRAWGHVSGDKAVQQPNQAASTPSASGGLVAASSVSSSSPWHIIGSVDGEAGKRVIVADDQGAIRALLPGDFEFDDGRPVRGSVDGRLAVAEDRVPLTASSSSPWGGELR
jgi:zona occludens toxin